MILHPSENILLLVADVAYMNFGFASVLHPSLLYCCETSSWYCSLSHPFPLSELESHVLFHYAISKVILWHYGTLRGQVLLWAVESDGTHLWRVLATLWSLIFSQFDWFLFLLLRESKNFC